MASHLNPPLKFRAFSIRSQPMQFQRGKGEIKTKKIQRKIKLKFKHIFLFLFLVGGIFYFIQQFYLFLISWDNLNVKEIKIECSRPVVKEDIHQFLKGKKLGNILLLDINHMQEALTDFRWVEEVRVRKIFPSSIKIEIKERKPAALLKKENIYLIDKEGVQLDKIESPEKTSLPLLTDLNNFQKNYKEKLRLAWKCLYSLSLIEKEQVEALDLTDYENVTIQLKGKKEKLILGNDQFSQKFKVFQNYKAELEKYGPLEYVDLRFHNRLIIKPQKIPYRNPVSKSMKEAN